jgi:hypothetical protein
MRDAAFREQDAANTAKTTRKWCGNFFASGLGEDVIRGQRMAGLDFFCPASLPSVKYQAEKWVMQGN